MNSNYNQFIYSVNFEVNSFNVGVKNEHAYRMLINYADWFEYSIQNYTHIISKEQFLSIIDQLYIHELDQSTRQFYLSLSTNQNEVFALDLLSLFKLYLILKVRRYQTSNQDPNLINLKNKLENIFLPLEWSEQEKLDLKIQKALPDFSASKNSNHVTLPLSLLVANAALMKFIPYTTLSLIIHIGIFLIIAGLLSNALKKTKSKDDQAMLTAWIYIIENNLRQHEMNN